MGGVLHLGGPLLILAVLLGWIALDSAQSMLKMQVFQHLTTTREVTRETIEEHFRGIVGRCQTLARDREVVEAMQQLRGTFAPGREGASDQASAPVASNQPFTRYHPLFREFRHTHGFADILLLDADTGSVVYTTREEADFVTALWRGPFADGSLDSLVHKALSLENAGQVILEDFTPHPPVYGEPAGFVAAPILDGKQKIGVLVLQISEKPLQTIMTHAGQWEAVGLGRTGESYLVGADFKMRSDSRPFLENRESFLATLQKNGLSQTAVATLASQGRTMGLLAIRSGATEAALAGKKGTGSFPGYRGEPAWVAYAPITIPGLHWAIISEVAADDVLQPLVAMRTRIIFYAIWLIVLLLGGVAGIGWLIDRFARGGSVQRQPLDSAPATPRSSATSPGSTRSDASRQPPAWISETTLQTRSLAASLPMLTDMKGELTQEAGKNSELIQHIADDNTQVRQHMVNMQGSIRETESRVSATGIAAEELSRNLTTIAASATSASDHIMTVASAT
ncbi:MAG: cache domain-containing protein, partial [Magnetococcales bacterium]|nr:cache domain-containing protein [Magnetococcales bacterium]